MTPWDVQGQEQAVTVLREAVARDEVAHAWAFVGPAGVGQQRATRWLAAAVNCGAFQPPCGACDICRRCLSGVYPALWEFLPAGAAHLKEDVRDQWLQAAFRSLTEGRTKVLRIASAERMNESAANTFLKGLEEPPPATVWVLEITDPDELPDTILSRCRVVRFASWPDAALDVKAQALGMDDATERGLAVRAAMGSPLQLERLAAPGGLDDLRSHRAWPGLLREGGPGMAVIAAKALEDEINRRTAELKTEGKEELEQLAGHYGDELPAAVSKQVKERHARREREARLVTMQAALDDLAGWLRDCLVTVSGGAPLIHTDAVDSVRGDGQALGRVKLLEAVDLVQATREQLESNVQPRPALEAMFLQLSALGY